MQIQQNTAMIVSAVIVASGLISGAVIFSRSQPLQPATAQLGGAAQATPVPTPEGPVEVSGDNDPSLGPADAKVTIIEFSDYQCPFCRSFWSGALAQIREEYIDAGKSVRFVFRDFPLSFHPMAQITSEAAECAGAQDRYWAFHDIAFAAQAEQGTGTVSYTQDDIVDWAIEAGVNERTFSQCLENGDFSDEVQKDFADGQKVGVNGTPTVFVNGQRVVGAQPFAVFQALIDDELAN